MTEFEHYRELKYSIESIGYGRWRWTVHSDLARLGHNRSGEVLGSCADAEMAAKRAIDRELGLAPEGKLAPD